MAAMIKVDLITGFLGSGKTTFLKRYARYLLDSGQKIGILENDHGAVNVDMLFLNELESERCGLDMVAGACDADCHRRRFKTKLIALGMSGYDRVLIEPSGVFDVDEFFDVLYEEPLDRWYEIGSVIAVVNADLEQALSPDAAYLLASQAANAGVVVLSKTQLCSDEQVQATVARIDSALADIGCRRSIRDCVLAKDWDSLGDSDFERIQNSGWISESYIKRGTTDDSGFSSVYIMNQAFTAQELEEKTRQAFASSACGRVFRVKGFARDGDGWLELNATAGNLSVRPTALGQEIIIVIGEELNAPEIHKLFQTKETTI